MLTHRQADLLEYISSYLKDNRGVSPSFDQMADALGVRSKSTVSRLLEALEEREFIERRKDRARAIKILQQPMGD